MINLSVGKMLYLLYAEAYSEKVKSDSQSEYKEKSNEIYNYSVTKGDVKSHLPSEYKEKSDEIYSDLVDQKLIIPTDLRGNLTSKVGRFSLTKEGKTVLVNYLANTDYQFVSSKGYKVLNALQRCIKYAVLANSNQTMDYEEFREKFKQLYFQQWARQSSQGIIVIFKKDLTQKFITENNLSLQEFDLHFDMLNNRGEISITQDKEDKLIQWVE
ncbi:MAG: hypothetical protein KA717_22650 [Woronichinia naegeliana WA131]|jgi:hypothetical protein|uniref:Uncharacterized protein n=1 Tax=Woronichinia naegeliana WA131 TaxID=2824559 RepID=A0A977KSB7_9CYAN|nr:MAG: hypothetical protein KA717_22650 [Woronichinia naegeliana WA131]